MEALPGVVSVGGTTRVPLGSTSVSTTVQRESHPLPVAELPEVQFHRAMHNYFQTMGIPIRRGRGFEPTDGPPRRRSPSSTRPWRAGCSRTRIRSDNTSASARRRPAHGRQSSASSATSATVASKKNRSRRCTSPICRPRPSHRSSSSARPAIRRCSQKRCAPRCAASTRTSRSTTCARCRRCASDAISTRRFILLIVGAFGVLALGLAAIGVYGVMSLIVSERTREVGVRLALGAEPSQLLTMIVGQATKLGAIGVAIGVCRRSAAGAAAPQPAVWRFTRSIRPRSSACRRRCC